MNASKADKKYCRSESVLIEDEHGREKVVPVLFVHRAFHDHITNYQKQSDRAFIEAEALRRHRLNEYAKSKAIAKDWPDSVENMETARKLREQGEAARHKEETDERHKQIAWENRAADRKILADAQKKLWKELPEVREIHRAYLQAQVLHEINAQKEFKKKLREKTKAENIKYERPDTRFDETEVKQEAEKAIRNKNYWEFIDKQMKDKIKLRETDKKEKMREDLEVMKIMKDELNESLEEKTTKAKRMDFIIGLDVSKKEKDLLKAEKLQDDEELERSVQAYNQNIDKYCRAIQAMKEDHFIPGASARKITLNQAQNLWETKAKTQIEKENKLFEKQRHELIAREEKRMEEKKRKESKQKISFKLVNDKIIQQKLQNKLLSQRMKNLELIQNIKVLEKEKERKIYQQKQNKNENQLDRLSCVEQELAKAREKKLCLEEINDFMNEKNMIQEKFEKKFVEYTKKLSKELQSENKDSRPVDEAIQLRKKTAEWSYES